MKCRKRSFNHIPLFHLNLWKYQQKRKGKYLENNTTSSNINDENFCLSIYATFWVLIFHIKANEQISLGFFIEKNFQGWILTIHRNIFITRAEFPQFAYCNAYLLIYVRIRSFVFNGPTFFPLMLANFNLQSELWQHHNGAHICTLDRLCDSCYLRTTEDGVTNFTMYNFQKVDLMCYRSRRSNAFEEKLCSERWKKMQPPTAWFFILRQAAHKKVAFCLLS